MRAMIEDSFWSDPDFDGMDSPTPLLVYIYLISNSAITCLGTYRFSFRKACHESRLERKDFESAFQTLSSKIMYDSETGWLWVRGYFSRQFPSLPHINMVKSVVKNLDALALTDFPFAEEFQKKHSVLVSQFTRAFKANAKQFQSLKEREKGKGKKKERESKTKKVAENTELMVRIGKWFKRRGSTLWTVEEAKALTVLGELSPEELGSVERYYNWCIKPTDDFRRQTLLALLQNWSGECDKALGFLSSPQRKTFV